MPRCSECKYGEYELEGEWYIPIWYCLRFKEWIDDTDAENDKLGCDGYEHDDRYDDTTA